MKCKKDKQVNEKWDFNSQNREELLLVLLHSKQQDAHGLSKGCMVAAVVLVHVH